MRQSPVERHGPGLQQLSESLFLCEDSCNVYLLRDGEHGVLIDAGSGAVSELASAAGIVSLEWVLHTHSHRDQCWGTPRLRRDHDIRVAVPEHERYLFEHAREHWNTRRIFDNYNLRNLHLSPGEDIPVDRDLEDYTEFRWRGLTFYVLPAKGHTFGSSALLVEIDGRRVAFTGDLIAAGGHVPQLQALETGYGIMGGVLHTLRSLQALRRHEPELLLPSHGAPIEAVADEADLLRERLLQLVSLGGVVSDGGVAPSMEAPEPALVPEAELLQLSEHLLWSGPWACANFYVLLSGSGECLLIDYGLGHWADLNADRDQVPFEGLRFVEHRLDQLRERFGVHTIEVVCVTHPHDDHVCGIPFLQRHHETECWALEGIANVLERPADRADLFAIFRKPIAVRRKLTDGQRVSWRDFELTFHDAPGHGVFHSVISAEIDGRVVAFTGDDYFFNDLLVDGAPAQSVAPDTILRDGFQLEMHRRSLEVIRRIAPDLICPGHREVLEFNPARLAQLEAVVDRLGGAFSAVADGTEGHSIDATWARLFPYFATAVTGEPVAYKLALRNNLDRRATYEARLLPPAGGWSAARGFEALALDPGEAGEIALELRAPEQAVARRTLVTAEVRVDGRSLGPVAEALASFEEPR